MGRRRLAPHKRFRCAGPDVARLPARQTAEARLTWCESPRPGGIRTHRSSSEAGPDVSITDAYGPDSDAQPDDVALPLDASTPEDAQVDAAPGPIRCLSEDAPCSYAFSMGRLTENPTPANDEFLQIGFYRFEPSETATACSFTGPEALNNVWSSFHALLTQGTGCYHRGLHSYPLIQVMGSSGTFRGWVGIEYQESDASMDKNLYHVMRKVEEGYY